MTTGNMFLRLAALALAKAKPGTLDYASTGIASG
jgi:hypothetical protein